MGVSHCHHQENSGFLDTREGYECKTCGKRFNSYQALGGHQGIHKIKVKPGIDEKELIIRRLDDKSSFGLHRCKQCMKEFETGQALGGHMRRHRRLQVVQKDLVLMQEMINEEEEDDVVRRQQQASDEEGKSDLMMMMETEEVSRLIKADHQDYRRRCELILAAREWRLSI